MSEGAPRIEVQGLAKRFPARRDLFTRRAGEVRAVDGVSFAVGERETLALVGESGSGKTTTGRALLRLVKPSAGRTLYRRDGWSGPVDLSTLSESELRPLRKELQIVFQDPLASLNPRMTAGEAIAEPLRVHRIAPVSEVESRVIELLGRVGLGPETRSSFPHELSGGQRQRVGIARALATGPRFVVLDEPVSALDVSVQVQILNLLKELQVELGLSYLFIAHDLSVVRYVADRVAVMYLGRIVETGTVDEIFEDARHPYTQALLKAMPQVDAHDRAERVPLKGEQPSAIEIPSGCRFHPRCPVAEARCSEIDPAYVTLSETHDAACLLVHSAPKLA